MHIGNTHIKEIYSDLSVDAWKEDVIENECGRKELKDIYIGRDVMETVKAKKYLGDLISCDGKNDLNIKERTNKANGNIEKIVSTLQERPYGRHRFKAYKLMREGLLVGGLLTNAESWINIRKQNLEALEKPDIHLLRKVLSTSGNPCNALMMLELGVTPIRFIIMKKRMQFLQYILKQNIGTMIRKVFDALKAESRKGDFVFLTNNDRTELEINISDEEIQNMSKWSFKKLVKERIKFAAFSFLVEENRKREKTRDIEF